MSKKHRTDPETTSIPDVPETPVGAPDEFSTLNTYGRLARYAIEREESALKGAVAIGKAMNAYATANEVTVKKVATKMHGKIERLAVNTLQQYASIAKLADEIGREFFDLGTFRNAQAIKGILGKLEDKQAQKEAIRLFVAGSDLKAIRNRFGLAKAKGIVASDSDSADVAADNGLDRDKFLNDLSTLRQLKLTKAGFQALAKKMIEDGTADTFLAILEEVKKAKELAKSKAE